MHTFPADGDYVLPHRAARQRRRLPVRRAGGRRADRRVDQRRAQGAARHRSEHGRGRPTSLFLKTPPIHVTAGPQRVAAAFMQRFEGPVNDLIAPIDHTLADTQIGVAYGVTTLPHLKDLSIVGPQRVTGVSSTPSRERIFTCRPHGAAEEAACATKIVSALAAQAFRRPASRNTKLDAADARSTSDGRKERDFESGIAAALEAILASPQFVFRVEATRRADGPRAPARRRRRRSTIATLGVAAVVLPVGAAPDAELHGAGAAGTPDAPGVLEKQVRRMLADPRAEALSTRFAAQWLRLSDVDGMLPDALLVSLLRSHARRGVRPRDRAVLRQHRPRRSQRARPAHRRLFITSTSGSRGTTASPTSAAPAFRRVDAAGVPPRPARPGQHPGAHLGRRPHVAGDARQMDHGSAARIAAAAAAAERAGARSDRRGRPAANCCRCASGWKSTGRARRAPRATASSIRSASRSTNSTSTGKWRIKDNEVPVDAAGVIYDGTKIDGPAGLRDALLRHQDVFSRPSPKT